MVKHLFVVVLVVYSPLCLMLCQSHAQEVDSKSNPNLSNVPPAQVLQSADEVAEFPSWITLACKVKIRAITETEKGSINGTKCSATCTVISQLKGDIGNEVKIVFRRYGNGIHMPGIDRVRSGKVYLVMLLGDNAPYRMFAAMKAVDAIVEPTLGTKPGDRLMAELLAMCKSKDVTMRIAAVQQIGIIRDIRGREVAKAAAENSDTKIARTGVIAQYRMGIAPDAKRVMELFNEQVMDVWYQESGTRLKDSNGNWILGYGNLLSRHEGGIRVLKHGLPNFDYATYIREGIKNDWVRKDKHTLYVFFGVPWKVQRRSCVPELVKLLEHPDKRVQWWAVTCLAHTVAGRHSGSLGRKYTEPAEGELEKWREWWQMKGKAYMAIQPKTPDKKKP